MGKTFRGVNKKDREKFQKSRKERQGKRRIEDERPVSQNNRKDFDA